MPQEAFYRTTGERRDIHTVSRLTSEIRAVLDGSFPSVWVQGEISNLATPSSGHIYFTLKDAGSQIRCAMFRPKRSQLTFQPANGQEVLVRARVSLYEPRGDLQMIVDYMEEGGEGALRLQFEQLKRRLSAEGLFDEALKRPLPAFPRQVGLITSPTGAAVRDLLAVLRRRFAALPVIIYPAQVQGEAAPASLIAALTLANTRAECDVLILARGGGSLEDLSAFNHEALARAIRASAIPLVTGIGHETDLSIADLVADRRAATPSAAAELVAPSAEHLRHRLAGARARLLGSEERLRQAANRRLAAVTRHLMLLHPAAQLQQRAQRLDQIEQRLIGLWARQFAIRRARLASLGARLTLASPQRRLERGALLVDALGQRLARAQWRLNEARRARLMNAVAGLEARSPLATLARGYAIVTRVPDEEILCGSEQAPAGTRIRARLARGELLAIVEEARNPGDAQKQLEAP